MITDLVTAARDFVTGLPEALQSLGVFLVSLIPFVEGEGAALIGVVAGVHPLVALPAAILGNILAVGLLVLGASRARSAWRSRVASRTGAPAPQPSADDTARRNPALRQRFEQWGVAGLSLLGPWFFIPGHAAAPAMVSFGARPGYVMTWQVVAIVVYTVVTGLIAYGLLGRAFGA